MKNKTLAIEVDGLKANATDCFDHVSLIRIVFKLDHSHPHAGGLQTPAI